MSIQLQCSKCFVPCSSVAVAVASEAQRCPQCLATYHCLDGIWRCLPHNIESLEIKEREKAGWQALSAADLDSVRSDYLQFPYIQESHDRHFYNHAATQFDFVKKILGPLHGKIGLDLGGSIGWAAYRFTQGGASMALADYNDSTPSGLGGAKVYLDDGANIERYHVDAEALPFADNQFDFVFSSSFLHHLPQPQLCLNHIQRILKPGGSYFAIMEAFCPKGSQPEQALKNADHIDDYLNQGINEQVFYQSEYKQWFTSAGLDFKIYNTRWDKVNDDHTVAINSLQNSRHYQPELLSNRKYSKFPISQLSRLVLKTGAWRILAHPAIFHHLRGRLLERSQKLRILHGRKTA